MVKTKEKRIFAILFLLIMGTVLFLTGCEENNYYESTEYLSLSNKDKIVKFLEREGEMQDNNLVYNIPYESENVTCDINLVYSYTEDAFMVSILDNTSFDNYSLQFVILIYDYTLLSNFVGVEWDGSLITSMGRGTLNRGELFTMTALDFAGLLMLQLATLIIGQELENYSIEFLEFYFNYYV